MKVREVIRLIEEDGWRQVRTTGSHHQFKGFAMDYVVILERGKKSFGAYVPDLPGCVAVGKTKREALRLIREAIEFHLEGMREDGLPIPEPTSSTELVRV